MRRLWLAVLAVAWAISAHAQVINTGSTVSSVLSGTYTVASLPDPTQNQAEYAFVSDLGGGADMVLSDGTYWKHIRSGVVTDVAAATSIIVTPLASPPIMRLTSASILLTASAINISANNLYPGYTLRLVVPSGVFSVGTLLGVSVGGGPSLPIGLGTWSDLMWNGTALVKIAGGTL